MTLRRSFFARSSLATSALVGALSAASSAQAAPVAVVPAASAVEPTPRATSGDGLCAHFVKAAASGTVNTAALATGLLTGSGTPAQALPAGLNNGQSSFHGLMFINDYTDDTTPAGNFPYNNLLPWSREALTNKVCESQQPPGPPQPYDSFAMAGRALINIRTPGIKTIAVASDDGYRLTIGGVIVSAFDANRGPAIDTRRVQFEAAGVYEYEFIYWEQGGLAFFEVAMSDDEVVFTGNSTANPAVVGDPGADDLTSRGASNGLPASFRALGDGSTDNAILFVRDADKTDDTCGPKLGKPSDICIIDNAVRQCGNGTIDALVGGGSEECDDANVADSDGCSATCTLEPGYLCAGVPNVCSLDLDGDSLTNTQETTLGTDPRKKDTDGDGLEDAVEAPGGVAQDTDGDTVIDALDTDDDGDGIPTATEIADTTASGASNDVDGTGGVNWLDNDADGDGAQDGVEGGGDLDGDGIPNYLDPNDKDGPTGDLDGDGLPNALETSTGTDPNKSDSDDDGLSDGVEDANKDGVFDAGETDPRAADTDGDGLKDGAEDANKDGVVDPTETDPRKADTDGGGVNDGPELTNGTNPLDPSDDNGGTGGAGGGAGAAGAAGSGAAGAAGSGAAGAAGSGAAGAAGSGAAGAAGSGAAGAGGSAGKAGSAGAGAAGAAGKAGSGGSAGAAGKAGSGGSAGAAGKAGSGGSAGAAGKAGSGGSAGAAGKAGSGGSAGAAGKAGAAGTTAAGAAGAGGSAGKAGGTSAGSTGTGTGNAPGAATTTQGAELEGGCSVAEPGGSSASWLGLGLLAGLAARLRRRR